MDQRERIEWIVRDELPGCGVVLYQEISQPVRCFGQESSKAVRIRIEDSSGALLSRIVIMDPDGLSNDKLRRVLRLFG